MNSETKLLEVYLISPSFTSFFNKMGYSMFSVLFPAGIDTTATTAIWVVNYLILHPDVQTKAQAEIDENIGWSKVICSQDLHRLPYNEAIFWEVSRMCSLVPFFIPHKTMADVDFEGFLIPKGLFALNVQAYSTGEIFSRHTSPRH